MNSKWHSISDSPDLPSNTSRATFIVCEITVNALYIDSLTSRIRGLVGAGVKVSCENENVMLPLAGDLSSDRDALDGPTSLLAVNALLKVFERCEKAEASVS